MRRLAASVLAAVAATAFLASASVAWARAELLDGERFAAIATDALASAEVRDLVAREITDRVLVGTPPDFPRDGIEREVGLAIAEPEFRAVFRTAALDLHEALLEPHGPGVALDLARAAPIVRSAVARVDERAADLVPLDGLSSVNLDEEGDFPSLRPLDRAAGLGAGALFSAGVVTLASAALADRRPRVPVGITGALVAAGSAVALAAASAVPLMVGARITDPGVEEAVEAVLAELLSGMRVTAAALAGLGAAVTALAWVSGRRAKPALLTP